MTIHQNIFRQIFEESVTVKICPRQNFALYGNSLIKITNSLYLSVKVDKSPGCSVKVNECTSAHIKVVGLDCSVVSISTCSSLSNESSNSPTNIPVDSMYLPANVSESKVDRSVDLRWLRTIFMWHLQHFN